MSQSRRLSGKKMGNKYSNKEDIGIFSSIRDKTSHYFGDENAVKILRMDSLSSSKDTSFENRRQSRNSNVKKSGNYAPNTMPQNSQINDLKEAPFLTANQTPIFNEKSNLSVDDNIKSKRLFSKFQLSLLFLKDVHNSRKQEAARGKKETF